MGKSKNFSGQPIFNQLIKLNGYAQWGGNVEQAMKTGIEYALQKGMIAENNEQIVLN